MKKQIKIICALVINIIILLLSVNTVFAVNTYEYKFDSETNSFNGNAVREQIYNMKNCPITETSEVTDEEINPYTGELIVSRNDLHLPGINGLDFDLKRFYSNRTILEETKIATDINQEEVTWKYVLICQNPSECNICEQENGFVLENNVAKRTNVTISDLNQWYNQVNEDTHIYGFDYDNSNLIYVSRDFSNTANPNSLSSNWNFDFPWIETIDKDKKKNDTTPLYLHMGSRGVWKIDLNNEVSGLANYTAQDAVFSTINAQDCEYQLLLKDGTKYLFTENGLLRYIRNAQNNTITFTYGIPSLSNYALSEIVDSCGRKIKFNYIDKANDTVNVKILDSVEVSENSNVLKKVSYNIELNYDENNNMYNSALKASHGTVNEIYSYEYRNYLVKKTTGTTETANLSLQTLTGINIEGSGKRIYEYERAKPKSSSYGMNLSYEIDRIKSVYNISEEEMDDVDLEDVDKNDVENYFYQTDANQRVYQTVVSSEEQVYTQSGINNNVPYSMYNYNANGLIISEYVNEENEASKTEYTYNGDRFVTKTKSTTYANGEEALVTYEDYVVDKCGNITKEYNEHAPRTASGVLITTDPNCEKYSVTYQYDLNSSIKDHLVRKTYWSDENTKVEEYTPIHPYYKQIAQELITVYQNGATVGQQVDKTDYEYYNNAQLKKIKKYVDKNAAGSFNNSQITEYVYGNGVNIAQVTEQTTYLSTDTDETITNTFEYDYLGNEITSINENGIVTQTEYNTTQTIGETLDVSKVIEDANNDDENNQIITEYLQEDNLEISITKNDDYPSWSISDDLGRDVLSYDYLTNELELNKYDEKGNVLNTQLYLKKSAVPFNQLSIDMITAYLKNTLKRFEKNGVLSKEDGFEILRYKEFVYNSFDEITMEMEDVEYIQDGNQYSTEAKFSHYMKSSESVEEDGEKYLLNSSITTENKRLSSDYPENKKVEKNYSWTNEKNQVVKEKTVHEIYKGADEHFQNKLFGKTITITESEYDNISGKLTKTIQTTKKIDPQTGEVIDVQENAEKYTYDYLGNLVETGVRKYEGAEEKYYGAYTVYNQLGQKIEEYDTLRNIQRKQNQGSIEPNIRYEYDLWGRVTKQTQLVNDAQNLVTEYEYDRLGNVIKETVGNEQTIFYYDNYNQLIEVNKGNNITRYEYDKYGNKIKMTTGIQNPQNDDPNTWAVTTYQYDNNQRLVEQTDPEGRKTKYTYNAKGELSKVVDPNGNITANRYDVWGRIVEENTTDNHNENEISRTTTYNEFGEVEATSDAQYEYDELGRVIKETTALGGQNYAEKSYVYDANGNVSQLVVKVDEELAMILCYEYDEWSRLVRVLEKTSINQANPTTIATYSYDLNGNRIQDTKSNKITTSYSYNLLNQVTELENLNSINQNEAYNSYSYEYNETSKISKEIAQISQGSSSPEPEEKTYEYDTLGRLTKETTVDDRQIEYTFDRYGNRATMKTKGPSQEVTTFYAYNKNSELQNTYESNNLNEKVNYSYDLNGNELSRTTSVIKPQSALDENTYTIGLLNQEETGKDEIKTYNVLNQLESSISFDTKASAEYSYDAKGLRNKKTVNVEGETKITKYVWDGDQIILELDEQNNIAKRYVRGLNLIYSDTKNGNNETEKDYYVYNAHGDVVQLVQEDGQVKKSYSYDSFGNEINPSDEDTNSYRYSGEYFDKETETIYLRARYYDPEIGRFITEDSYTGEDNDPLSLNLYTYCHNDGVNNVDPSGHWGGNVHKIITKEIAKGLGFDKTDSNLLGLASKLADYYTKKKWKISFSKNVTNNGKKAVFKKRDLPKIVTIDKIKNKNNAKKINIHLVGKEEASSISEEIKGDFKKNFKKKLKSTSFKYYDNAIIAAGIAVHALQDVHAHMRGSEPLSHARTFNDNVGDADNIMLDWKGKFVRVKINENNRLKKTIKDGYKYLKEIRGIIKSCKGTSAWVGKNIGYDSIEKNVFKELKIYKNHKKL